MTLKELILKNAPQGVFLVKDMALKLADQYGYPSVNMMIHRLEKEGSLFRIKRGTYSTNPNAVPTPKPPPPERVTLKQLIRQNLPEGVFSVKELAQRLGDTPFARVTLNVEVHNLVVAGLLYKVGPRAYSTTPHPVFVPEPTLREKVLNCVPEEGRVTLREILAQFPKQSHSSVRATLYKLEVDGLVHKGRKAYQREKPSGPELSAAAFQYLYEGSV